MKNKNSDIYRKNLRKKTPLWRSLLYMPADNERFLAKAQKRGADAIILDLEDSIAPGDKIKARKICKNAIKSIERQIYKEGTHIPDKDSGYDHMNDALGYLVEYNFPLKRNFAPSRPKRWS